MTDRALLAKWRDALRDSSLDTTAKAVGFVIATYWRSNGTGAFPAKATIAEGASLRSVRAVDNAVLRLEDACFIDVSRSKGRSSNTYLATLPTTHLDAGSTPHDGTGFEESNPASGDRQPRTALHSTPHPGAGESVESVESVLSSADARKKKSPRKRAANTTDLSAYDH